MNSQIKGMAYLALTGESWSVFCELFLLNKANQMDFYQKLRPAWKSYSNWIQIFDCLADVTLKFDGWLKNQ